MRRITVSVIALLVLSLFVSFGVVLVDANPGSNTVNLNFHKTAAETLWTGNTTTQIMNTRNTGYWSVLAQSINFVIPTNETYYNTTFFLYPALAGALSATAGSFDVYLNSTKSLLTSVWIHSYYTSNGNTNTSLYSGVGSNATVITPTATLVTIGGGAGSVTIGANYYLFVTVSICIKNDTDTVTLWYDTATLNSRFVLTATDPLTVSLSRNNAILTAASLTVTVTDVFGGYDIASNPIITFTSPSVSYATTASSTGDTQYSNTYTYTFSAALAMGSWTGTGATSDNSGSSYTSSSFSFEVLPEGGFNWDPESSLSLLPGMSNSNLAIIVIVVIVAGLGILVLKGSPRKRGRRRH